MSGQNSMIDGWFAAACLPYQYWEVILYYLYIYNSLAILCVYSEIRNEKALWNNIYAYISISISNEKPHPKLITETISHSYWNLSRQNKIFLISF